MTHINSIIKRLKKFNQTVIFITLIIVIGSECTAQKSFSLRPLHLVQQDTTVTIKNQKLTVSFANNKAYSPSHWKGYSGISELYHSAQDSSVFMINHAGFNFEFIVSGDSLAQKFEPRRHSVELYSRSENEVMLYQSPTPQSQVESLTIFELVNDEFIDVTFRCVVHAGDFFKYGYAGLFWASYIDTPKDKNIYFKGFEKSETTAHWIKAISQRHGIKSTHKGENDEHDLYFAPNFNIKLFNSFSDYRYESPFYYGRFHNMVLAYLFDSLEVIRFAQSPTGGGRTQPAWDFQFIIPDLKYEHEYSFRARIIYKPFISEQDIEEEYESWKKDL